VTAASTAQLAILLVDARHGIVEQTRRHATLAHLLGIPHLVVAVNKMDLVEWREDAFDAIVADFRAFAARTGIVEDIRFVPMSALDGDMVVDRGEHLDWYDGPTLLQVLETAELPAFVVMSTGAGEAHVLNLCVAQAYRGQGIGGLLLEQLLEFAGSLGVGEVFLEVRPSNTSAIRLYQSLGFSQIGIRRGYYQAVGGREDAVVLRRLLGKRRT